MNLDISRLIPLNGYILVIDDEKESKSGSLYLPENTSSDSIIKGVVLATSKFMLQDGRYSEAEMEQGDEVIYYQHAGAGCLWEKDKRTYRILKHNEILSKLKR